MTADLFSLGSFLSVASTRTWMIHGRKNESTCGYKSNLPDWHCCIFLESNIGAANTEPHWKLKKPPSNRTSTLKNIPSMFLQSSTTDTRRKNTLWSGSAISHGHLIITWNTCFGNCQQKFIMKSIFFKNSFSLIHFVTAEAEVKWNLNGNLFSQHEVFLL